MAVTGHPSLEIRVLTELAQVESLRSAWEELLADSEMNEVFLSPTWLLAWWKVFGPQQGRRLCFVCLYEGGQLIGLAPLLHRRWLYRPGIPFRRLELLASGERERDAICSDYLNVIARRGREVDVTVGVVDSLASGQLGAWDELVIPLMAGDGPMPGLLAGACRAAGWGVEATTTTAAPYIPLPASWDDYLRQLGQSGRYLVTRSLRDLDQWAGGTTSFVQARSPEELREGQRILHALHHDRWNGTEGGVFRSTHFLAFHDQVMADLNRIGALELIWLVVRDEPIAAMYNMVWNRKTRFYQCGRKIDLPRHIRPGVVILAHGIRQAIEQGRQEFDFLGGVARYKTQLALASRPLVEFRVVRPAWRERLRRLAEYGADAVRFLRRGWRRAVARTPGDSANG